MAEMKNYTFVNQGFDVVLPGLVDYVTRELKDYYGPARWWREGILDQFYPDQKRNLPESGSFVELAHSLDFTAAVNAMKANWKNVFRGQLVPRMRDWMGELQGVRNETAHRGMADMSDDDAYRALDTMMRLAKGIDDTEAAEELYALREKTRPRGTASASEALGSEDAQPVAQASPEADLSGGKRGTKMQRSLAQTLAVGSLPSWRELVQPQEDVATGRFKRAEFAADLSRVAKGKAEPAYQDPVGFFSRTYLTGGLRNLLVQGLTRVSGGDGEPVVQLKTAFGGGKTHSMIALYHLMKSGPELLADPRTQAMVAPLLREAGALSLPSVHVAVVVGTQLSLTSPARPQGLGSLVYTLWGQIVAQLALSAGKPELFELVKKDDAKHVAPGAEVLTQVFNEVGPCLVLLDELVSYAKSLESEEGLIGGTFDNFINFIQQLTEAARNSDAALVVASIPESEREVGSRHGREALEAIEHTFGRMEAVWKPVTADEGFAIVSKRLFRPCADIEERDRVCRAFAETYQEHPDLFPVGARQFDYEQRLRDCYPVHPEVYDRIYEDWATLDGFQRTRGVLRFMAIVIQQLWEWQDRSPLILPGSLPLYNQGARDELTKYLPEGWDAVVDTEVDGPRSVAFELDQSTDRYGRCQAGRRLARTMFLGSAPRGRGRGGLDRLHVMLGSLAPGDSEATFADALFELKRRSRYLYDNEDASVFWYDTRPTLAKTVEEYAARVSEERVATELKRRMAQTFRPTAPLCGVHLWPTGSADIPDEQRARLVVLGTDEGYSRLGGSECRKFCDDLLRTRGSGPRLYRNMLVFCACEESETVRLKDACRRHLAWTQVEAEKERLNFDLSQVREVKAGVRESGDALDSALRDAYRWLLVPHSEPETSGDIELEAFSLGTGMGTVTAVVDRLRSEDALKDSWAPMLLKLQLDQLLWRDRDYVSVGEVWGALSRYTYLPRLADYAVLRTAVVEGSASLDYFGVAGGIEDGRYLGLSLGERRADLHESDLLVRPVAAATQKEEERHQEGSRGSGLQEGAPGVPGEGAPGGQEGGGAPEGCPEPRSVPTSFTMTVPVDPTRVSHTVRHIMSEIVDNLTMDMGTQVTITLDVSAFNRNGFSPATVSAVRENGRTLELPVDFD